MTAIRANEPAIRLNGVSFQYDASEAGTGLTDVRLTVPRGACLLLCGPSGCGKTTLIKVINGLIPHCDHGCFSGVVEIGGADAGGQALYERARLVSSVFQNPKSQFFNVETESELAFALENANLPTAVITERVRQVVDELGLEHLMHRNVFQLSGGEKQIIAVAAAYAADTSVVVLDEPSANLDAESTKVLASLLCRMKRSGKTLIIAEHRLSYLAPVLDRVCYLSDGRIEQEFEADDFFRLDEDTRRRMGLRRLAAGGSISLDDHWSEGIRILAGDDQAAQMAPRIALENIAFSRRRRRVFSGLTGALRSGEVTALTGRNGLGKTTFSRVLCGLEKETAGQIFLDGRPQSARARRRRCYIVMQDVNRQLFAESVRDECRLGNEGVSDQEIDRVLLDLSLTAVGDRHPNCLSGGQKQRLAVAVALLADKSVLIFDEPTSGLDYRSMLAVGAVLRKLADQGRVILVVTHDAELIETVCDRCLVLTGDGLSEAGRDGGLVRETETQDAKSEMASENIG